MKVIVINCGSSSVKFQFVETTTREKLAWGIAERIGEKDGLFTYKNNKGFSISKEKTIFANHETAIKTIVDHLQDSKCGVVKNIDEIHGVGHRVVHGAEEFCSSVEITEAVINSLKKYSFLAPLHNPANITGIEVCKKLFPTHTQCGVFDTAFHQKMPKYAFLYAIPQSYYKEHMVKRYGFHGTSHRYVSQIVAEKLGKDLKDLKVITCHLGNGASITAIKGGISVDTSMGLTPLEGLMMGTRAGDMDPALPLFMMENFNMSLKDINALLNKKSGILGVSGKCSDMRELHDLIAQGDKDCELALQMYCYRLKKYIGSYVAAMGGLDALVFTGGIGENDEFVREYSTDGLEYLGIKLDKKLNLELNRKEALISASDSRVPIYIIPTNEELVIALDTEEIINSLTHKSR